MKKLLLSILILFSFSNLHAQKKTAALAPMGSLGELNELEKRVIFNSLQESLSKYYVLASQKMYEKAEEEAFQEMDADECTESQCIAIIQELLQTEFFFMFEIVKAGSFQQMKITRVDLDGNRDVRTETCDNCSISQVNGKVDGLVKKLTVSEEIISTPTVEKEKVEPKKQSNQDSKYSFFVLINTPYSSAKWEMEGGQSIPYKKNTGLSFGLLYKKHLFLYKTHKFEFGDTIGGWSSDYYVNYIINSQYLSYNYKFNNNFILGYNHFLNGSLSEDISDYNSYNNRTFTYKNEYGIEGYGISIGYILQINQYLITSVFDRYNLNSTEKPMNDSGVFYFQGLSIGGGMKF